MVSITGVSLVDACRQGAPLLACDEIEHFAVILRLLEASVTATLCDKLGTFPVILGFKKHRRSSHLLENRSSVANYLGAVP